MLHGIICSLMSVKKKKKRFRPCLQNQCLASTGQVIRVLRYILWFSNRLYHSLYLDISSKSIQFNKCNSYHSPSGGITPFNTEQQKLSNLDNDNVYIAHGMVGYTQTIDLLCKSANLISVSRGDWIKLWSWIANQLVWSRLSGSSYLHGIWMEFLPSVTIVKFHVLNCCSPPLESAVFKANPYHSRGFSVVK